MVSRQGFDLRERPWLPVPEGSRRTRVGLRELLVRAHELTDVDVPLAPAAAGLWRFLYLLAARVTGLDDAELEVAEFDRRRGEVLEEGRFDGAEVDAYFERYADRFDLFDVARPWLQDPRLVEECPSTSGINRLIVGRPAGNNQVWFDHHTEVEPAPVPAAEAAWHLIAALYYGPSGRCTTRKIGPLSEGNTTAGPLRGGLSCHPVGRTVFESLVAGIPFPDAGDSYRDRAVDLAPWELPELPDPRRGPVPVKGMARELAGRFQHAVLLTPDKTGEHVVDATLTWAWREKCPSAKDQYLIYQTSKKGDAYPRPASVTRAMWRDLDALLMHDVGEDSRSRPLVFDAVKYLPAEFVEQLRVRVFGFDQDGQTRDKRFFTRMTPSVLRWLEERDPQFVRGISSTRQAAERVGSALVYALRCAWVQQADPDDDGVRQPRPDKEIGPWVAAAEGRYWPQAERVFWKTLDDAARQTSPTRFDSAPDLFAKVARDVYDDIADQVDSQEHWRMTRALARNRYRVRAV
ncbi:type I-E CRISPR-associated protein Cse1/CasA [Frankia sp. CiP3]|uniref:type I-E CRISPR-associated protein Cse1/CasA n=1 Tax=Frankia sp. CiP3 TaxID=2880971 RepID=UPI001EF4171C|nr:type I-E CRISPR-associated protein Cse1/CasA [Frankia sp. CiP3]